MTKSVDVAIDKLLGPNATHIITNALRVAAERFDEYAADVVNARIAEQFTRQASEARGLIERIEEGE